MPAQDRGRRFQPNTDGKKAASFLRQSYDRSPGGNNPKRCAKYPMYREF
jgi:hypothetical protein